MIECEWRIAGYLGTVEAFSCSIHGRVDEDTIREILPRLASRHLNPQAIVDASIEREAGPLDIERQGEDGYLINGEYRYVATRMRTPDVPRPSRTTGVA